MESAEPEFGGHLGSYHAIQAGAHFKRGLVGKCDGTNRGWIHGMVENEMGNPGRQYFRLAATGSSKNLEGHMWWMQGSFDLS